MTTRIVIGHNRVLNLLLLLLEFQVLYHFAYFHVYLLQLSNFMWLTYTWCFYFRFILIFCLFLIFHIILSISLIANILFITILIIATLIVHIHRLGMLNILKIIFETIFEADLSAILTLNFLYSLINYMINATLFHEHFSIRLIYSWVYRLFCWPIRIT